VAKDKKKKNDRKRGTRGGRSGPESATAAVMATYGLSPEGERAPES